jgi:glycosyltransferase 2 family protein
VREPDFIPAEGSLDAVPHTGNRLKQALGYLIALLCLAWVFHNIDYGQFLQGMTTISWMWVPPAVFFDILSYCAQGVRWQLLLRPLGNVSPVRATQAIYVGLFTNEIVPLRAGELVRMFLISCRLSVGLGAVIPSLVVERFFDGIWLALAIGAVAFFMPLPQELLGAEKILSALVLLGTALFVYLTFLRKRTLASESPGAGSRWNPSRALSSFLGRFAQGVHAIGTSRFFLTSFLVSLFILVFQIIALWLMMRAYGLPLSIWAGSVVLLILHLGTAIPNAPSNIGTYQFFTVVGLTLFGVEKTPAVSFSVGAFLVLTIPLWVIGLISLWQSGMTLAAIRREITRMRV